MEQRCKSGQQLCPPHLCATSGAQQDLSCLCAGKPDTVQNSLLLCTGACERTRRLATDEWQR